MPSDSLYRAILLLLGLDVVAGALLMLLGHFGLVGPALAEAGAWLGIAGGLLYLFFRWWGRHRVRQEDAGEP